MRFFTLDRVLIRGFIMNNFLEENKDYPVLSLQENLQLIPPLAGIYAYINNNGGGTYVGKTKNLRQRFVQHLNNKKITDINTIDYQLQNFPNEFDYRILIYGVEPNDIILTSLEATFIERFDTIKYGYNKRYDLNDNNLSNKTENQLVNLYQQLRNDFMKLNAKNIKLVKENEKLKQQNKNQAAILKNHKLL